MSSSYHLRMDKLSIIQAWQAYLNKQEGATEKLEHILMDPSNYTILKQIIQEEQWLPSGQVQLEAEPTQAILDSMLLAIQIQQQEDQVQQKVKRSGTLISMKTFKWVAAAVIIFAIAGTWWTLQSNQTKPAGMPTAIIAKLSQAQRFKNDVKPGREGAILRLANGKEILLDTVKAGQFFEGFTKGKDGLTFGVTEVQYATVITPKAHIQQLQLADGTQVWLNAGSSIKFPTSFSNNTREVDVTGEVYFEVAKNKDKPFIVHTKQDDITVLGTHFNVNTYGKQITTLLEGSVKVASATLTPGQQFAQGKLYQAELDEVMAWKNGRFLYDGAEIKRIMADIERWYDVEIEFKDEIKFGFVANVARTLPVSELLKILEETGDVHFTIEGRKITVMK